MKYQVYYITNDNLLKKEVENYKECRELVFESDSLEEAKEECNSTYEYLYIQKNGKTIYRNSNQIYVIDEEFPNTSKKTYTYTRLDFFHKKLKDLGYKGPMGCGEYWPWSNGTRRYRASFI